MTKLNNLYIATIISFLSLLVLSCDKEEGKFSGPQYSTVQKTDLGKIYHLAVHPLHNPKKLAQSYEPLIDYLNQNINNAHFELEASRDYQTYEAKFRSRKPAFILPNPWQTLEGMKAGYNVIAMAGDADDFKGVFIVRKDSSIRNISDLKGKVISYPSSTALAASIMPQYFLHTQGINVTKDIKNVYVGSQESAIMNVFLKQSDVGVTWPPPWRLFQHDHPDEASELMLLWETPPLMNNSVMVRDDVPDELVKRVQLLLIELHQSNDGKAILRNMSTSRFYSANNASYAPVKDFIRRFEDEVRSVE